MSGGTHVPTLQQALHSNVSVTSPPHSTKGSPGELFNSGFTTMEENLLRISILTNSFYIFSFEIWNQ